MARQLLDQAQATAEPGKRTARLIEINLLRSLICQKENHGDVTPAARELFQQALALAEPQGYTLLFLEQGADVKPLLRSAADHHQAPPQLQGYAQRLLDASRTYGKPTPPLALGEAAGLVEALTAREMEVLQLVALGDSNRTIAGKLVITVRTVKKHITNILGKLGVSNRTQAVARARDLGLLSSD